MELKVEVCLVVTLWILVVLEFTQANVRVSITGLNLVVKNDFFSAVFRKGVGKKIMVNKKNLANSFYIDYTSTDKNKKVLEGFSPTSLDLLSKTDDFVHVVYKNNISTNTILEIEQHFIVTSSVSGIYQYIVIKNNCSLDNSQDEIRMSWRMNSKIMDYIDNGIIQMKPPPESECNVTTTVQDATFLLPDGTYYSKYDLAGYVRESNYYGVLGNGYGTWIIHPSHEYFSGGPLKQDLLAHQYGLVFVYITGSHFGTPHLKMSPGFEKLYGPWLVYFNQGTKDQMVHDVKNQTKKEIEKWPYNFVDDARYPVHRGTVVGKVEGVKAMVILSPQDEDCDLQVKGYSYNIETINGSFKFNNIRPSNYLISVYPLEGASVGTLIQKNLTVKANETTDAGSFEIKEPTNRIWQIGKLDHRSSEFKYSNEKRNYRWHLEPPAKLTYIIANCTEEQDWYYAQTKNGTWKIQFEDTVDGKGRFLWISIAGTTFSKIMFQEQPRLNVYINGQKISSLNSYENDKSIYRGALQSGNYHYAKIEIFPEMVVQGTNFVSLELVSGMFMYDCLVYLHA